MKLIDSDTVHRLLDYPSLVAALHKAHQGPMPEAANLIQDEPGSGDNKFVALVGWQRDQVIAVKMVGVFPANLTLKPPQASVQGLVAVFDAKTGAPRLVADGAAMTFRKTAADSALGACLLARKDAKVLLVVGAGGLAPHMIAAHCSVRPSIERALIWNRTFARAEALAKTTSESGLSTEAVGDLDAAVAQADVISCVTMSTEPLVRGAHLKPGAHLDLVGAYLPTMREADDEAMARGTIFVDTRNGMEGAGDLRQPVDRGAITWQAVAADLFDLCTARSAGRRSDTDITIFKNVGGGHLDLFTAQYLASVLVNEW
jgi:ornithine cyclodeaminase/alanine dehydrogenase-like protein (mu-crystallin family)